jgi:hypothetical protein
MYLFFYMALGLMDFDGEKRLLRPLEGVGPENLDLALVIGFVHIKIITSCAV